MTRPRRGYALIEMLVVISILAVMLTLCAGMIHLLLKLDRAGRSSTDLAADLARLAHDFRTDAHASAPVEPPGQAAERLTFSIAKGKTAEYLIRPADILRTVREGDKVRRYEIYRRPARSSVRFDLADGPHPFATLIIDRPVDGKDDSLYRDSRIEAEIGKHRRLEARPE